MGKIKKAIDLSPEYSGNLEIQKKIIKTIKYWIVTIVKKNSKSTDILRDMRQDYRKPNDTESPF